MVNYRDLSARALSAANEHAWAGSIDDGRQVVMIDSKRVGVVPVDLRMRANHPCAVVGRAFTDDHAAEGFDRRPLEQLCA